MCCVLKNSCVGLKDLLEKRFVSINAATKITHLSNSLGVCVVGLYVQIAKRVGRRLHGQVTALVLTIRSHVCVCAWFFGCLHFVWVPLAIRYTNHMYHIYFYFCLWCTMSGTEQVWDLARGVRNAGWT